MQEQEEFEEALQELNEELDRVKIEMERLKLVHQYRIYKLLDKRKSDS